MNRSAVAHIPASQFAFARSEDTFTVRLRAAKGDLDSCTLFYGLSLIHISEPTRH